MDRNRTSSVHKPKYHSLYFLHAEVPQGQAPGIFLGDSAEARVPPPAYTMHGCPPAVGQQLSAANKVFPYKVKQALEAGMLEYILLDLLTDESCC